MDKTFFTSYKFKPSDIIEGLNRYFAETKAYRYLRVPLEIKNGEVKPGNYYVIRNIVFDVSTPKIKESGYYYLICDPEEVVGVAINWLREEHDIFYTPGMNEPPIKDPDDIFSMENLKETKNFSVTIDYFCVDDAAKEYEQATRKDLKEALQRRLHDAKRRIIGLEAGHAEKSKIIDRQVARIRDLEKSIAEKDSRIKGLEADIAITNRSVKEQREFITKVAVLLETTDPYIEREYAHTIDVLSNIVKYPNRYRWLYLNLKEGMESMLQEAEERED